MNLPSQFNRTGRDFGGSEMERLAAVLDSGCLICTRGKQTPELERRFAERYGVPYALAVASGTAAVHVALAAAELQPGDEVITTPITDFGAIAPILFQGAAPIFADVDPHSLNITPETVEARLTPHTKAVVLAHLFGTAADVHGIVELCKPRGIMVIEDVAQSFLAHQHGRLLGTIGDVGCFSFQQGKHITSGEGGIVITSNPELRKTMWLATNKGWGYNDPGPDHWILALNYRITELQSAVLNGQMDKLDSIVSRRGQAAAHLDEALAGLTGIEIPRPLEGCDHTYWRYALNVDPALVPGGAQALGRWLNQNGCEAGANYVGKPAYKLRVFRERRTFGASAWPWEGPHLTAESSAQAHGVWDDRDFPGALQGLDRVLVLPWNEHYTSEHVQFVASMVRAGVAALQAVGGAQ